MSYLFDGSTNRYVNMGTLGSTNFQDFSICAWIKTPSTTGPTGSKILGASDSTAMFTLVLNNSGSNDRFDIFRNASGYPNCTARSNQDNFSPDTWYFVGGTIDLDDTAGCTLGIGTESSPYTELGSYDELTLGVGGYPDGSGGTKYIGANAGASNTYFKGDIAFMAAWNNVILSEAEFEMLRLNPFPYRPSSGTLEVYCHLGLWGASNVPDLSANSRSYTPTSCVVSPHVPINWAFGKKYKMPRFVYTPIGVAPTGGLYGPLVGSLGGPV